MITDSQTLVSATHNGHPLKTYDDGFGGLFIFCNSTGPIGIIRATDWYSAYEIMEDEFQPEADESEDELIKEYGEEYYNNACFQESYGFRPNGGIYQKDLCYESLVVLTPERKEEWLIELVMEEPSENEI